MITALISVAAIAGSPLFSTDNHSDVLLGATRAAVVNGTGAVPSDLQDQPSSIDIISRTWTRDPNVGSFSSTIRFRLRRQPDGTTVVDQLTLTGQVLGIHVRPETGDMLELSILGSSWEQNLWSAITPAAMGRVYLPLRLTALGFSDTDADTDRRLKYFGAIGAGAGTDWIARVYRGVGVHGRIEGGGSGMFRYRGGTTNQVRMEAWFGGEASLVMLQPDLAWMFGVFFEHHTQWELTDDPTGVDRQVMVGGIRLGMRLFIPSEQRDAIEGVIPGPEPEDEPL